MAKIWEHSLVSHEFQVIYLILSEYLVTMHGRVDFILSVWMGKIHIEKTMYYNCLIIIIIIFGPQEYKI